METETDSLADIVTDLLERFGTALGPALVQITERIVAGFLQLLNASDGSGTSDGREMTAMGMLTTLSTLLEACQRNRELFLQVEERLLSLVTAVFNAHLVGLSRPPVAVAPCMRTDRWHTFPAREHRVR